MAIGETMSQREAWARHLTTSELCELLENDQPSRIVLNEALRRIRDGVRMKSSS